MPTTVPPDRLRDQLGNADIDRVSTAAFGLANSLQHRDDLLPGESLGALTAAFILAVETSHLPAADLLGLTRNIMADADGRRPEFKAVADFLTSEVLAS